ncbi:MAG: protein kinase, partial [Planctomycetaceae bacterium]
LFITICEAVQHAHQKGIIHRDIKPSNILVTMHDDKPVPKVIDFGVAKATNQRLVEQTLFTNFAQMIGTPAYMSPEQAQLSGLDVDTRSDVYSLGVLLYELLTGSTPFDQRRLREAGYDELSRIIREEEPPRPSVRVTAFDAASQSTMAENRTMDWRKFTQALRGDLDWIVMKALEKDRTRRYESVGALMADVQRHLDHEPVTARPPSAAYRLRKFARRRRRLFASLALAAGFLAVSLVGLAGGYVLISRERTEALKQRDLSQQNEAKVLDREATIRKYLYAADIQLAATAYAMGDGELAREKLLGHVPAAAGADNRGFEWYHLWNLCADEPRVDHGHHRAVYSLAFSRNGGRLVSTSADRTVVLWNGAGGTPQTTLRDFSDDVNWASFSNDGNLLATAEESKMVRIWDLSTGRETARLVGFAEPVATVFFTADQQAVVATELNWETHRATLSVWDLATQQQRKTIEGYHALAVDDNAGLLAATRAEGELSLWSLPELELRTSWPGGHHDQVLCAEFRTDGKFLATGCRSGEVALWDLADQSGRRLTADRSKSIRDLAFSPDGRLLVAVGDDGAARIWDTRGGALQKVLPGTRGRLWSVDVSPDGAVLAIGCADGSIEMRGLSGLRVSPLPLYESPQPFRGATLDSAGGRLAVIDTDDRFVSVLNSKNGHLLRRLAEPNGEPITALAFSADDRSLWTGNVHGTISQLDSVTGEPRNFIASQSSGISSLTVSPTGRYLATNGFWPDRTSHVWDTQSHRAVLTLTHSEDERDRRLNLVRGFLSDSVVVISRHTAVALWDLKTDQELPRHFPHENLVTAWAASPDRKCLAVGTDESIIHLWDIAGGRKIGTLNEHQHGVDAIAFSPDGRTLATAGDGGELKLWSVPTMERLYDLSGHTGKILALAFTPDGRRLFSAGNTIPGDFDTGKTMILMWDGSVTNSESQ